MQCVQLQATDDRANGVLSEMRHGNEVDGMRTIDADALLKKIDEDADFYLVGDDENSKAVWGALLGVKEQINAMPTVKPQRMRGRWKTFGWNGVYCECSECGNIYSYQFNFCPFCGADMREGQDVSD